MLDGGDVPPTRRREEQAGHDRRGLGPPPAGRVVEREQVGEPIPMMPGWELDRREAAVTAPVPQRACVDAHDVGGDSRREEPVSHRSTDRAPGRRSATAMCRSLGSGAMRDRPRRPPGRGGAHRERRARSAVAGRHLRVEPRPVATHRPIRHGPAEAGRLRVEPCPILRPESDAVQQGSGHNDAPPGGPGEAPKYVRVPCGTGKAQAPKLYPTGQASTGYPTDVVTTARLCPRVPDRPAPDPRVTPRLRLSDQSRHRAADARRASTDPTTVTVDGHMCPGNGGRVCDGVTHQQRGRRSAVATASGAKIRRHSRTAVTEPPAFVE